MRFQVPQYIEVEDKIFGPFTLKQFLYIAGGAGMCFVLIRLLPLFVGILLSVPIVFFSLALAFYKVNERQGFIILVENAFKYATNSKLYIWKKEDKKPVASAQKERNADSLLYVPKLGDSRLKDMTWSLDVASSEILNPVTKNNQPK